MFALENVILAMESNGMDETTIFGMVNCILKGFIRDGVFAPEYLEHIKNIEEERIQLAKQEEFRKAFGAGSTLGTKQ